MNNAPEWFEATAKDVCEKSLARHPHNAEALHQDFHKNFKSACHADHHDFGHYVTLLQHGHSIGEFFTANDGMNYFYVCQFTYHDNNAEILIWASEA